MYNKFKEALLKATTKEHREEIMKIPDRPLTLEDVLIALVNEQKLGIRIDIATTDEITKIATLHFVYSYKDNILFKWQLGSPAHKQSDETLIALTNLLK